MKYKWNFALSAFTFLNIGGHQRYLGAQLTTQSTQLVRYVDYTNLDYIWQPDNDDYPAELSILITTLDEPIRKYFLNTLTEKLILQAQKTMPENFVEIVIFTDKRTFTTGYKRNVLVHQSHGRYICFVDDDDEVSPTYIEDIVRELHKKPDVVAIKGIKTINGKFDITDGYFSHSIEFDNQFPAPFVWNTTKKLFKPLQLQWGGGTIKRPIQKTSPVWCKYVAHLNPIRRSIAIQIPFEHVNQGEDVMWSQNLHASGLLKKECRINDISYHYRYNEKLSASTGPAARTARIK